MRRGLPQHKQVLALEPSPSSFPFEKTVIHIQGQENKQVEVETHQSVSALASRYPDIEIPLHMAMDKLIRMGLDNIPYEKGSWEEAFSHTAQYSDYKPDPFPSAYKALIKQPDILESLLQETCSREEFRELVLRLYEDLQRGQPVRISRQSSKESLNMESIKAMGFPEDECEAALEISENNVERAISLLVENPKIVKDHAKSKVPLKKSTSFKDKFKVFKAPSFRLFSKPVEENSELSEAFTIHSGSQVRTMYHLRVQVFNIDQLFYKELDIAQELAIRSQTCSSLYSHRLSGAIVLVHVNDVLSYAAKAKIFSRPELHFESFEDQVPKEALEEGDFFITKHSNLLSVHVVFHLVFDENEKKLLSGYRSILHIANAYDIHHLTLPITLVPDEQFSMNGFHRRIESVLKQTKGIITEQSRKGSQDSTFVFTLPKQIPQVREVFDAVCEKVTEIFRTV